MAKLTSPEQPEAENIRRNLYLLVACCVIPALLIILYVGISSRQQAVEQSHRELEGLANEIAHIEMGIVKQARTLLKALAASSEVKSLDFARCRVLFEQIKRDNPELANISLADSHGVLQASATPFTGIVDVSDSLSFQNTLRTGRFCTGEYYTSRLLGIPVLHFSYPLRGNDGDVIGVLIVAQDLVKSLEFLNNVSLPSGSRVALSDRNGVILMDRSWQTEPTRAGQRIIAENWAKISNEEQNAGDFFAKRYDGVMAYIHFKKLTLEPDDSPFMVVNTNTPRNVLLASAERGMWINLALLTLAAILAFTIARTLGRIMVLRHISALKASEQEFRLLAEAMPQIVWVCSPEGLNLYFNQQWVDYTGLTLDESSGDGWNKPFHPDDRQIAWDAWQNAIHNNAVYALECRLRRADGAYKWWLIRAEPVRDANGVIYKWFGTCTDIDDIKQYQTLLANARDEANVANKAKSEFLANMSHEIRTPLNGILGMLQLLQSIVQDSEQTEYVQAAISSTKRLSTLLSDILDLARIEAGKMSTYEADFELKNLREAVLDLFTPTAKGKELELEFEIDRRLPSVLVGDEARVRQILFNLVGNSIKFTQMGFVHIDVMPIPPQNDEGCRVLFIVQDTGLGISDEQLKTIYEPFVQGESSYVRRFQGAGLGLSIVRRLAKLLGGEIAIDSTPGEGTTIYLSLPLKRPVPKTNAAAPGAHHASHNERTASRLLIAEDDSVSSLTSKRLLEKEGYSVVTVKNGQEALQRLTEQHFDLILMDIQMPIMDGVETTKAIRGASALGTKASIPIIAMTAYAMTGDREKFLAAGMNDYISKPVNKAALMNVLEKVMAAKRKSQ